MRSLGKTLVLGTTLATEAIVVAAGVLLYVLVRASLMAEFDRSMLDKARFLASTVEQERDRLDLEFDDLDMREFEGSNPAGCLLVATADGATLYRSPTAGGLHLVRTPGPVGSPRWRRVRLPDGRNARAVSLAFLPRVEHQRPDDDTEEAIPADGGQIAAREPVTLVLARSTEVIDQTLARLVGYLFLVGLVAIVASTATLWWLVRHSLRPLERLAADIGRLSEEDLAKQIDHRASFREIQPVVDRLNDLLRRLDAAFRRERAFSADVAHELRTPLAGLRLKLDVATSRSRQPHEYQQAIDDCRHITAQMQTMVENLLCLARLEAGQIHVRRESVCLDELIRELWLPLDATAKHRRLNVEWSLEPGLSLISDRSQLSVAVRNLLENAVVYADENGSIRVCTASTDVSVEMSVSNSGSRLTQAQAEQAFEYFWRGDPGRSDAGVHCGLGLSLAWKTVALLGGTLSVRSHPGAEFEVTLAVPKDAENVPIPPASPSSPISP